MNETQWTANDAARLAIENEALRNLVRTHELRIESLKEQVRNQSHLIMVKSRINTKASHFLVTT